MVEISDVVLGGMPFSIFETTCLIKSPQSLFLIKNFLLRNTMVLDLILYLIKLRTEGISIRPTESTAKHRVSLSSKTVSTHCH